MSWGEEFFNSGWKGQPWTVIDRRPAIRTEEEFRSVLKKAEQTENWVFGLWEDNVLHAPTFGIVAPDEVQRRVILAIEAYPARRVIEFEQLERPHYERMGCPRQVIEHMTPRLDAKFTAEHFKSPILTTANDGLMFVGIVGTADMVFGALTRCEVPIDLAIALRILFTVHGDPGEKFEETPFSAPFHPREFKGLAGRLWRRSPTDPTGELLRVLVDHVPEVVESLRKKPAPARRAHAVGRRRLATAGSNALWPTRRRRLNENPRADPDEKLRTLLMSLTSSQRTSLEVTLARAPRQRGLMHHVEGGGWSVAWWKEETGGKRTSTLGRTRQEVLKKIYAVKREGEEPAT